IETHLCTTIDVCEQRDPKGLYEKARHGKIDGFTGISAPYEAPQEPELRIDTGCKTVEQSVATLIKKLAPRLY
ncbi:MAG: adenylyl-sulfate kinase, partial [Burkholderiaceae bacterium]